MNETVLPSTAEGRGEREVMQERYLFRGKRNDGSWAIGYLADENKICVKAKPSDVPRHARHCTEPNLAYACVLPSTIGQCTGLKDVHGMLVFEGDIVQWVDSDGIQRTDTASWMNGGLCLCNSGYTVGSYGDLEIISNIHDGQTK